MADNGIQFDDNGVQIQINEEWYTAEIIDEQEDLLFVSVDLPDGETSLQTWQSDADGNYTVIGSGICDIELPLSP